MSDDAPQFRPQARTPRGFQDRRARDLRAERTILTAVTAVYERYGFEALETSAFEYADALGKFLPDADRPNEGVFALQDDDEQWMALRYDLTAPLARFAAQNWETLPKPFRRYAFGTVWRNEKPGPGRYREFVQCDADTVGSSRPEADAEIVAMAVEGLEAAGLPRGSAVIKLSNRKLMNAALAAAGVTSERQTLAVLRAVDKFDKFGLDGVKLLLGRGRLDESGDFTKGAELDGHGIDAVLGLLGADAKTRGAQLSWLEGAVGSQPQGREALDEMARIDATLTSLGVGEDQVVFDPSVVRGLEYYTGAVFEAELLLETTDEQGHRVRFGSEQTETARGPVVVIAFSPDHMADYFAVAGELRAAGIPAEVYLGSSGMRPQMKYADRRLSPAAVIIGDDERAAGTVTVKDLDLGRALSAKVDDNTAWRTERPGQATIPRGELIGFVRRILEAGE